MWNKLKNELEKTEDRNFLKAFIAPLKVEEETKSSLILSSPSNHIITILEKNNFPKKISLIANTLFNYDINVKFKKRVEQNSPKPLQEKIPVGKESSKKNSYQENRSLNKFYTFDNFVPGPSNYPVFAAAKSIAQSPGSHYNPFVIYASTGLGPPVPAQGS
ncbi:MAG: DnaA/Hda family protein [bacterium]